MDKLEIIERISQLRTRANLSARALSQRIGLNDGYISRMETKKDFLPSMEVLLEIIDACNSTPEEFFHSSIFDYKKDMELLDLLSRTSEERKDIALKVLKMK